MSELKTKAHSGDVLAFINAVEDEQKKADSLQILQIMKEVTGEEPQMWGGSIVGFGSYHYKYASGREGDWFLTGFSPRKQNISIYLICDLASWQGLDQLGKYKIGKSCLYIKRLSDIDLEVLKDAIKDSIADLQEKYG